jgi:hypothetical protein
MRHEPPVAVNQLCARAGLAARIHAEYACGLQLVKLQMRPTDHFSLAVDSRAPCDDQTPP